MVGYSRVLFDLPDKNKKITDYYCRFKTATFNGSVIKPVYRGLNLQYEMHQYSLKNIQDKKIILSLVHPDNINSKRNLEKSGFKEIDMIFVYGEKERLLKEKKANLVIGVYNQHLNPYYNILEYTKTKNLKLC